MLSILWTWRSNVALTSDLDCLILYRNTGTSLSSVLVSVKTIIGLESLQDRHSCQLPNFADVQVTHVTWTHQLELDAKVAKGIWNSEAWWDLGALAKGDYEATTTNMLFLPLFLPY